MGKQNWWERRSAADDGDFDDDADWLDDFDFDDFEGEDTTVDSIWGRYAVRSNTDTEKVVNALKIVQGFVDTFATGDKPYRVTFDEGVGTAGTDFKSRTVLVSHKPLFDPALTTEQANTVLTAMGCHEASHVRYGRKTAQAIENHPDSRAQRISNCLDDVRIERRFTSDYPGYKGIFDPALEYVATRVSGARDTSRMHDGDLMVAACRYAQHVDWTPETAIERDWWQAWADRWTRTDKVTDHVAGVEEALAHVREIEEQRKAQPKPEPQKGEGEGEGAGQPQDGAEQSEPDAGQGSPANDWSDSVMPECIADGITEAANEGAPRQTMTPEMAQDLVEGDKARVTAPDGTTGEVYWAPGGIARTRKPVGIVRGASQAIRSAFARSRTGHFATTRGTKTGRVDNRSLTRIASSDYRLFNQRTAPSEGRYLVWVLVDCSESMDSYTGYYGSPKAIDQATAVAGAVATASRFLPNVDLHIWGWTDGWKGVGRFGLCRVWKTGDPIANVGYLGSIKKGGTPDKSVVGWAGRAIVKAAQRGQEPVLIVASDGQGSMRTSETVDAIRKTGVRVVSVAIGAYVREDQQEAMYGPKNYIPWGGSIGAAAKPLGELIARVASGRYC